MQISNGGIVAAMAAALSLCGADVLRAQQTGDQVPAFRSGVELVTVDVGVLDKQGEPLRGLDPADFVVTVGGQRRRVVTAEFIDAAAARPDAAPRQDLVPVSSNEGAGVGRLFVFIVDQNTLESGEARRVASAASRLLATLTFVDRSALMLLPTGPNVGFTWAHDRVRDALQRVVGLGSPVHEWEFGSLSEARDIANRNLMALRTVGQRECGGALSASAAGQDPIGSRPGSTAPPGGGPAQPSGGAPSGDDTGGSGTAPPGSAQPAGGGSRSPRDGGLGGPFGLDACMRNIQMQADWTWRGAQMTSLASLTALRHVLEQLGRIPGDKTVILISGGWPLDDRDQTSWLAPVATDAAAARATLFTLFAPGTPASVSRRVISSTPTADRHLHLWPLETLAAMTGGGSFRADTGAEHIFERLGRELAGYYRIGVEKEPGDADGRARRMKVQVSRGAATVRAREIFDARTFEDRNWTARLGAALAGPIPATAVGLRVTSYLSADPDDAARLKLVLTGEASRVDPGQATFRLLLHDVDGSEVLSGEQPLGEPHGDGLSFSANIPVPPGSYIARIAVIDGAGRVGSVDHRVDAHHVPLGPLSATGPLLVRVPRGDGTEPRLALDGVRQDERLALQVDLQGDGDRLANTQVVFEIAATPGAPPLIDTVAELSPGPRGGSMLAQALADLRVLPPGPYVARAKVSSGSEPLGEVHRAFFVIDAPRVLAETPTAPTGVVGRLSPARSGAWAVGGVQPFALDQVLAPDVLGAFLDRVAARPDANAPAVRDLLARARTAGIGGLTVSDAQAAEAPVAAFLKGLTLLAQRRLDQAATAFRSAMRASSDFYPAMVYLGACYAAGGRDKEAAGAWSTALIREGDALPLHVLLSDALLRQERADLAFQTVQKARARWPDDEGLKRRLVLAALLAGERADGLQALDELIDTGAADEPSLAAALLVLYEAFVDGQPVQSVELDRARMTRFADAYRARGGPSLALVDTWLAAAARED
jgi:VWFA-related protein